MAAWDKAATQLPHCAALNWEQRRGLFYIARYMHVMVFQSDPLGCIAPRPVLMS